MERSVVGKRSGSGTGGVEKLERGGSAHPEKSAALRRERGVGAGACAINEADGAKLADSLSGGQKILNRIRIVRDASAADRHGHAFRYRDGVWVSPRSESDAA